MRAPIALAFLSVAALIAGCGTAAAPSAPSTSPPTEQPAATTPSPSASASLPARSSVPTPSPTPVVLEAQGTTNAQMASGTPPFVGRAGGQARCRSGPDSRTVAEVTALDLGELGSGTLRATVGLPLQGSGTATAEIFIDGGDLQDGSFQPFWSGPVKVTESGGDGATGRLTFHDIQLEADPGAAKAGETGPPADTGGWPASLSGTLSWSCGLWSDPTASLVPLPSTAP